MEVNQKYFINLIFKIEPHSKLSQTKISTTLHTITQPTRQTKQIVPPTQTAQTTQTAQIIQITRTAMLLLNNCLNKS